MNAQKTLNVSSPAHATDLLPVTSALHRWAVELHDLRHTNPPADAQAWQLQGHAVVLESDDADEVREMLHRVAGCAGFALHLVGGDRVHDQLMPLLREVPEDAAALVYLMPGDWMRPMAESAGDVSDRLPGNVEGSADEFLRTLGAWIKALGARPLVLVTAARSFDQLSPYLRQAGLFDRRIRMPEWDASALVRSFVEEIEPDVLDSDVLKNTARLGAFLKEEFPDRRRRGLMVLALKRLAKRERRRVRFADLVHMAAFGTADCDACPTDADVRYRTAVHEAGHALVSHLDSELKIAPSYCTAVKSHECHGRMVPSYEAPECTGDDPTVKHVRHKIRVRLAGLAAEHLLLGVEGASAAGAGADLDEATKLAVRMFADWGVAHGADTPASRASNLATAITKAHPADNPRVARMVRQYLKTEFLNAMDILRTHRTYLEGIVAALCQRDRLTQEDFERIWTNCVGGAHDGQADRVEGAT